MTDCFIPSAATSVNVQVELDKLKFFAKPKVALDSVGGESGLRLAEALAEVCEGSASTFQHYLSYLDCHRALWHAWEGRVLMRVCPRSDTQVRQLLSARNTYQVNGQAFHVSSDATFLCCPLLPAQEGQLLCFGCASGKPPPFTWQSFVFRELRVSGFNFRAWLRKDVERNQGARFLSMLRSVGKLVSANLLALNFTE